MTVSRRLSRKVSCAKAMHRRLVLAGEALDAVIALEAGDTSPERVHRQVIHQLREYELPFVHGRLPAAVWDGEAGGSRESGPSR